jgi:DNA-binding winged helix-turn-helix (wHTH) protein
MFGNPPPPPYHSGRDPLSDAEPAVAAAAEPSPAPRRDWIARFGRCEVRVACRELLVDGKLRPLQPRPFDLLVYLIAHRDRVVTAEELLDAVWGETCVQQGSLPAAVMRVRKALLEHEDGAGRIIRTYQRVGYRFVAALEGDGAP